MVFSLDETCCVSSCVVLRRVAALNFIFPALTTPLSAQAFLGYDVLETTASSYLKVPNSEWVRVWSSWPRGIGKIIPNPHFRLIFTSVFLGSSPPSYSFINATVRIPVTRSHCDEELHRNLSDMRRSTF